MILAGTKHVREEENPIYTIVVSGREEKREEREKTGKRKERRRGEGKQRPCPSLA